MPNVPQGIATTKGIKKGAEDKSFAPLEITAGGAPPDRPGPFIHRIPCGEYRSRKPESQGGESSGGQTAGWGLLSRYQSWIWADPCISIVPISPANAVLAAADTPTRITTAPRRARKFSKVLLFMIESLVEPCRRSLRHRICVIFNYLIAQRVPTLRSLYKQQVIYI
jgi:hypothetical protein